MVGLSTMVGFEKDAKFHEKFQDFISKFVRRVSLVSLDFLDQKI